MVYGIHGTNHGFWNAPCLGPYNQNVECRILILFLWPFGSEEPQSTLSRQLEGLAGHMGACQNSGPLFGSVVYYGT